jgi:hypothetical protein
MSQIIYASLPFLPATLLVIGTHLAIDTHHSHSRIRLLEKDASKSHKLIHVLSQLEKGIQDAVADFVDDPGESLDLPTDAKTSASIPHVYGSLKTSSQQPIITQ